VGGPQWTSRTAKRAPGAGRSSSPQRSNEPAQRVLALQRSAGNAATARLLAPRRPTVARFAELEHKAIGDRAVPDTEFRLSGTKLKWGNATATYGDIVAMGDYFESPDEITELAGKPGTGRETIGEVYYALYVEIRGEQEKQRMGKEFDETAKEAVKKRFYRLAAGNIRHFPNPRAGDTELDPRTKAKRHDKNRQPEGEAANYRDGHLRAIRRALELGEAGQSIGGALALNAFYDHFLTDAFSAGHLRTARESIERYWSKRPPDFNARFMRWMADTIADWVDHNGAQYEQAAPRGYKRKAALEKLREALKDMPEMNMGAVVGLAVHDYDSERGVMVRIGGKKHRMVGDGHLFDGEDGGSSDKAKAARSTMDAAIDAVQASVADIEKAYKLGAAGIGYDAAVAGLTREGKGLFAPERLVPEPVPDNELTEADRALTWSFPNTEKLLEDGRMRRAIVVFANNKAKSFDAIMDDPGISAVAKQGLQIRVATPLSSSDPNTVIGLFQAILAHPP
jgi:hypothetical protein